MSTSTATSARRTAPRLHGSRLEAPPEFRFTLEHLDAMPQDDQYRYELVDGRLLVSAAASRPHQHAVAVFVDEANSHLGGRFAYPGGMDQRYDEAVFLPDVVVFLPDGPDPIVEAPDRLAEVVVEVTSPGNRTHDFGVKRQANERNGVREYWIIDLQERRTHVHVLVDGAYEVTTYGPEEPAVSTLMDEFAIRLVDLEA